MKKLMVSLLATVALCVIVGCASLQQNLGTSGLVIEYATAKVIEAGKTPDERLTRAQRIKSIASDAKTWLDGDSVTIDFLQQAAQARIAKLNLGTADLLLANALVQAAVQELQAKIGAGVIPPDKLVTVNQLLKSVLAATELYGA